MFFAEPAINQMKQKNNQKKNRRELTEVWLRVGINRPRPTNPSNLGETKVQPNQLFTWKRVTVKHKVVQQAPTPPTRHIGYNIDSKEH